MLLEAAPRGLDPDAIGHALAAHPGVSEVHDLHVWEVTSGFPALSAHVLVPPDADCHARRAELELLLAERFGLEHTTLQVEHESTGGLLDIIPLAAGELDARLGRVVGEREQRLGLGGQLVLDGLRSGSNAESVSVAVPRLALTAQLPATRPSTRNVAWTRRFFVASALRRSSVDHPRAVLVGEHQAVELGQQARPARGRPRRAAARRGGRRACAGRA